MIRKKIILFVLFFVVVSITALSTQALAKGMDGGRTGMSAAQNQAVTDSEAAIRQRLITLGQTSTARLTTARLTVCQSRRQKINDIISHGVEQNKKQLAVFQKIEANVEQFYINKKLSSDSYASAVANADAAEADAVAAIEISANITFDCTTADSTNPGSAIKEVMTTRHSTLQAYRTAVKDLIVVVKKANNTATQSTTNTTKEQ